MSTEPKLLKGMRSSYLGNRDEAGCEPGCRKQVHLSSKRNASKCINIGYPTLPNVLQLCQNINVYIMSYVILFHRTWHCHVRFLQPGFSQHRALGVRGQGEGVRRRWGENMRMLHDFTVAETERERGLYIYTILYTVLLDAIIRYYWRWLHIFFYMFMGSESRSWSFQSNIKQPPNVPIQTSFRGLCFREKT